MLVWISISSPLLHCKGLWTYSYNFIIFYENINTFPLSG